MKQFINKKIITVLLIPILLIPVASLGYAHFTDLVAKQYKIHVRCPNVEIGTYKVLSPWDDELIQRNPPDDQLPTDTIHISTKIFPGWYVWIGFVLQNFGMFPASISSPHYDVVSDPEDLWENFTVKEYFYGPWPREDVPQDVYAKVFVPTYKQIGKWPPNSVPPPPPGNVSSPIPLEPYGPHTDNSMVMWIFLKLRDDHVNQDPFTITITITIVATT